MPSVHRLSHPAAQPTLFPSPPRPDPAPRGLRRRVEVDPWGVIADSKDRLERLAALAERHLAAPGEVGLPSTEPPARSVSRPSERRRRAVAATTIPGLLAVQAWRWESVHELWHPSMLLPIGLGLALCLALGASRRLARSLRVAGLPILLLLQTALAVGLIALYQHLASATVFERMMLGLALEAAAAAACCAGFALLTVARGDSNWGFRGIGLGLSLAVGAIPFLG